MHSAMPNRPRWSPHWPKTKAEAVARDLDPAVTADCAVIGCDSMLYVNGVLVASPGTPEQTRRQWNSMAGRSGELFTGAA